ncbi:hypothetical protein [Streptomyces sp. NPDC050504]|uniref:hypothetical protein n=1 Tax=Streptomyces sp. NPDC050504 TaxID=3365618 RepID=UPI0037B864B9
MRIWTEHPAKTDVEALVGRYFGLLRAGRTREAERLVEHTSLRHVLRALWTGSVGAGADDDRAGRGPAPAPWEQDLSWLRELGLGEFSWGESGDGFYVKVVHRERTIEVALGFWIKQTDAGWVLSGPSTLW